MRQQEANSPYSGIIETNPNPDPKSMRKKRNS
jgi:hypothetical protein